MIAAPLVLIVSASLAWAFWLAGSGPGAKGASAAASVNQGMTPMASATGAAVTITWAPSTLSNGAAVSGYIVRRYDVATLTQQTILSACTGAVASTACTENSVPPGQWRYSVTPVAINWSGAESPKSTAVTVAPPDTTAPVNAISLSTVTGSAGRVGATIYYRGVAAGSFTLSNAVSDDGSGPASSATAALTGTTTGWSHSPSTVSTPSGGPYVSNPFSWAAGTTSAPTEIVTGRDVAGNTAATTFSYVNDSTSPTTGTITYTNGYMPDRSVAVAFTTGTDGGSGVATRQLQRATAALASGTCGTFGGFVNVGSASPTSPYTDSQVSNSTCYMYQYVVTDFAGNSHIATSASVARVDLASVINATSGLVSFWRLGETSGTTAADSNGTNTGTYVSGVTLGATGAIVGDANKSATFDGVDDVVTVPDAASLKPANITLEAWVKPNAGIPRYTSVATKTTINTWSDGYGMFSFDNGIYFWVNDDGYYAATAALPTNTWSHVVGTYDGATIKIYLNGVLAGALPYAAPLVHAVTPLLIGDAAGTGNYHWPGGLDDIALYNRALTATEVAQHYQLGTVAEATGPTGGSVDASGLAGTGSRYSTSTVLSVNLDKGTDPNGVSPTGAQLLRATSTLTSAGGTAAGFCGTFPVGSYSLITGGSDPASPKVDTVADQACYSYRYVVVDTLGNATTYTSPGIKVDTTAPGAPPLAFSGFTNTFWSGLGSTVYYRALAASGSFTATGTATDTASGIASYLFPALGTNWTSTPGALGVTTYSWTGAPAAPGTKNVTATNNAGATSANASFTMTADDTAPTAGTVSYFNGVTASTSVSVSFTTGTDSGSGVGTRLLQRATATLTGTTCGTFGAFATVATGTNPTSPLVEILNRNCYMYRYVVADNVGNQDTATSASVVKVSPVYVDTIAGTSGLASYWRLGETVGTTAADSKGANTGTYAGGVTQGVTGAIPSDANKSASFDGVDDVVSVPDAASLKPATQLTVEAWVKPNAGILDFASVATKTSVNSWSDGYGMYSWNGNIYFWVNDDTNYVSTTAIPTTSWSYVVGTYDGATVKIYLNGVLTGSFAYAAPLVHAVTPLLIGNAGGTSNYRWLGGIDEVAIYNRALTATEVAQHYAAR